MLESLNLPVAEYPAVQDEPPAPEIVIEEVTDTYGKFYIEPLERGYGATLGNPIRRVLLSSISGAAVTWVKIEDVLHEYSVIPHVKEEVMDILYNIGQVRIRSVTGRPGKMRLEVSGEGVITASDIATSSDFEIVNPEQHIATIDASDGSLSIELNVEPGKGYQTAITGDSVPRGVLPLDAIFNPVRKVNFAVERVRVGQITDYERLILEVWTNATLTPTDAIKKASEILVEQFFMFKSLDEAAAGSDGVRRAMNITPDVYQTPLEKLGLSPRTLNSLKRAGIERLGQLLEKSSSQLMQIRNFGEKSRAELNIRLAEMGYAISSDEPEAELDDHSPASAELSDGEEQVDG